MPTADQVAGDKSIQETEARQRAAAADPADAEVDAGEIDVLGDLDPTAVTDGTGRIDQPAAPADDGSGETAPPERTPLARDVMRDQIVAKMRTARASGTGETADEAQQDAAEIRAFARAGLPPELQDAIGEPVGESAGPAPALQGATAPEPAPQPRTHKLIIRGKERVVNDEELIDLARKAAAADDYLGEARATLDGAKASAEEIRRMQAELAARAAQPGTPPANGTEQTTQQPDGGEPHASLSKEAAEALLYGDPEKAAELLDRMVDGRTAPLVAGMMARQRRDAELARNQQALQKFGAENPGIAGHRQKEAALRAEIFELQRQDLIGLGVDLSKLPPERQNDPNVIANLHLDFRSDPRFAARVKTPEQFLEEAKAEFLKEWGGGQTAEEKPNGAGTATTTSPPRAATQAAAPSAPRVQVNVDRTARRTAIPQQPARTAVLRQPAQAAPAPRTRSQIIAEQAAARGKIVS